MGLVDIKQVTSLDHPYEEGVTVSIRPLRGTEMDEAADQKVLNTIKVWGASLEILSGLQAKQAQEETLVQRLQRYDATTLLKYAIVAWSYEEPVTEITIRNLDASTRSWLVEEVVTRNTRPLPLGRPGGSNSSPEESLRH